MSISPLRACLILGIGFVGLVGLSACASMSAEECTVANWREVGHSDAANGFEQSRLEDHRRACAEAGITPDLDAYLAGFAQGLPLYCTRQRGFDIAASGGSRSGQCDRKEFGSFAQGFDRGVARYRLTRDIDRLSDEWEEREQIATDLATQIATLTARIDSGTEPAATQDELIRQRDSLSTLLIEQQEKLTGLERRIDDLQDQADAIQP